MPPLAPWVMLFSRNQTGRCKAGAAVGSIGKVHLPSLTKPSMSKTTQHKFNHCPQFPQLKRKQDFFQDIFIGTPRHIKLINQLPL